LKEAESYQGNFASFLLYSIYDSAPAKHNPIAVDLLHPHGTVMARSVLIIMWPLCYSFPNNYRELQAKPCPDQLFWSILPTAVVVVVIATVAVVWGAVVLVSSQSQSPTPPQPPSPTQTTRYST